MDFDGKKEMEKFITNWEGALSSKYRQIWEVYKKNRDIVAKKIGLSEKEKMMITIVDLCDHVIVDIKERFSLSGDKQKVINTKGNTKVLETASKLSKIANAYEKECSRFLSQYDIEIKKLANNKR